ncbi:MAG: DEAD/DEAH box helicase family protein, partial [Sarcina sp.]
NEIADNRIIGVSGSMNLGKSYFMLNDLNYYCMDKDYKLIIVIPTTAQLDQVYKRYKDKGVTAQYARFKANKKARVILTTPDSLPKIVAMCEELSKNFILAVDEAHEIELSYMYRKAFKNVLKASEYKLCKCTLMFSATLDNLILSDTVTFDKLFNVEVKDTFFNAKKFELMTMKKQSVEKMASLIKKLGKQYDKVFYKVDSLDKLNSLNEILGSEEVKGVQNSLIDDKQSLVATIKEEEKNIYLSSKNRKGNVINEQITSDKEISNEFKFIGFTSLVNSGIEIRTSGNIVVINFANKTFNFCNEIQFIGRFRNGVELYIITIIEPVEARNLRIKIEIA